MVVCYARLFTIAQAQTGPNLVSVIWNSGVSTVEGGLNVLKFTEIWSGRSELYIILQVSTVEGYLLSRTPL